jgi:hypothetical protein
MIQSCDVNGDPLTTGANLFAGLLTLRIGDRSTGDFVSEAVSRNIAIDDDLDGKYSLRIRIEKSGVYDFQVTVDGLHIFNSPFSIIVTPLEPCLSKSHVSWKAENIRSYVGEEMVFRIHLQDQYGNPVCTGKDVMCGIVIEASDGTVETYEAKPSLDERVYVCSYTVEHHAGCYVLRGFLGDASNAFSSTSCSMTVATVADVSSDMCTFILPERALVGEAFQCRVEICADNLQCIDSLQSFSVFFKPLSHSLGPRALVRRSSTFNPLEEVKFELTSSPSESMAQFSAECVLLCVSGDYVVKLFVGNRELLSRCVYMKHSQSCPEFTEVINTSQFFSGWSRGTEKVFYVQVRDKFGNLVLEGDDEIESYIGRVQGNMKIQDVGTTYESRGLYKCSALLPSDAYPDTILVLHVLVRGQDILYSPFSIDLDEHAGSNAETTPQLDTPQQSIVHQAEAVFRLSSKVDVTRSRAYEVLKKERRKIEAEREKRQREQAIKRCGGGFTIQYSKDI